MNGLSGRLSGRLSDNHEISAKAGPQEATAAAQQAKTAAMASRLDDACHNWAVATHLDAGRAEWWAAYGRVLMRLGRDGDALVCYRKALALKPATPAWKLSVLELQRRKKRKADNGLALAATYYDAVYRISDKYKAAGDESVYRPVWEHVLEVLLANNCRRVVDLGCGPGQFSEFLLKRCAIVYTGYDFSGEAIAMASAKGLAAGFHRADLTRERLVLEDGYDTVIATEFLEHVVDDIAILRRLEPGAMLIGSVPNFDSFGHTRYFASASDVEQRYGALLTTMTMETFAFGATSKIFAFHGRLRG